MAARKTKSTKADRTELIEALNAIEKEKQISKEQEKTENGNEQIDLFADQPVDRQ